MDRARSVARVAAIATAERKSGIPEKLVHASRWRTAVASRIAGRLSILLRRHGELADGAESGAAEGHAERGCSLFCGERRDGKLSRTCRQNLLRPGSPSKVCRTGRRGVFVTENTTGSAKASGSGFLQTVAAR